MAAASISKTLSKGARGLKNHWIPTPLFPHLYSSSAPVSASASASVSSASSVSSLTEPQSPGGEQRRGWTKWLLFVPGAVTFGLGSWQILRRQDKINMLDYRRKRLDLEPIPGSNLYSLNEKLDSLEFRRVKAKGFFDEKKSIYVGPRSRSISGVTENGYYLITPLMPIPDDPDSVQSPILVNRGWVPRSWRDKYLEDLPVDEQSKNIASPSIQESERSSWWRFWSKKPKTVEDQVPAVTPVEVVGVVRGSEKPSIFVPENDLCSRQWFYVDVPAISRASGLAENTIYIDDINENVNPSNPYPVPKEVSALIRSSVMPQDHLNYTLTWYSLSAAVTFMAFKRITPKKSRR
ncbi:hypothetical protein PVL29_021995 [Vitis rotundifolia]|uniref:SURF1-like protein n=1 Tax=Vitis rotundifolia TaxID=103349 RepID=A0AA38YUA6_VITRO|nr:hypothetical protein PVL29_021995 [Vitis rotundifolia]